MTRNLCSNPVPGSVSLWLSNVQTKWTPSYANGEIVVTVQAANAEPTLASFYNAGLVGAGQFITSQGVNYQREFEVWADQPAYIKSVGMGGFVGGQQIPANTWTRVVEQVTGYAQSAGWPKYIMSFTLAPKDNSIPTPGVHSKFRRAMLAENPSGKTIPYGDPVNRVGWHWAGAANNSQSWGETWPANLLNGIPGGRVLVGGAGKLINRLYLGAQQVDWRQGSRLNGIPNPRMNPSAGSPFTPLYTFANYGTGAGNRSGVATANMPEGLPQAMRMTWTTASTTGGYGGWSYNPATFGMPNMAGTWVRMGMWVRPSVTHKINARLAMSRVGQPQLYVSSPTWDCLAGTWQWLVTPKYFVDPAYPISTVLAFAYIPNDPVAVGELLDVTGGIVESFATEAELDATPPVWFDGATVDNPPYDDYAWVGTPHESASTDAYYWRATA